MSKKTIKITFFCLVFTLFMACLPMNQYFAEDWTNESTQSSEQKSNGEEESEFNFIKSDNCSNSFLYSDNWLLFGGITLIMISIAGITITINPKILSKIRNTKKHK